MQTAADLIPKWTKRVVTETTGRDPLGLSRVSFIITDYILTGIITTTDRARYYSFYCWALWHTTLEDDLKKYQDFVTGFRRREAVLALATIENNSETSPVGVVAATSQLEKGKSNSEYNCDFRVLPANQLGGYGQYYSGSLYQLGLTHRLEDGIDRPSEGAAVELAQSFHSSIKNTPYIKNKLFHDNQIKQQHLMLRFCSPLGPLFRDLEAAKAGVGIRTMKKLEGAGITTFAEINKLSIDELKKHGVRKDIAKKLKNYVRRRLM